MRKKFLSALLVLAMALTMLPGTALAAQGEALANGQVLPAILRGGDSGGAEDKLYTEGTYQVSAKMAEQANTVDITVQAQGLQAHKAGADAPTAYWVGFAVIPPEGKAEAVKMKVSGPAVDNPASLSLEGVEAEDLQANVDGGGSAGFAQYINALNADFFAGKALCYMLQWCDGSGEAIEGLPATVYAVKLDKENFSYVDPAKDSHSPVTAANLSDRKDGEGHKDALYEDATYTVTPTLAKDEGGYYVQVEIDARRLEKHQNAQGTDGYWAGYSVARPDGAESVKYAAAAERGGLALTGEAVKLTEEDDAINFYFDVEKMDASKTWSAVQWLDGSGKVLSTNYYHAVLAKDLTMAPADGDTKITAAILSDFSGAFTAGGLAKNYAVDSYKTAGGYTEVIVTANSIQKHRNGAGKDGYWTGAAFVPAAGAETVTYKTAGTREELAGEGTTLSELEKDVTAEGGSGLALYVDAKHGGSQLWLKLQWDKGGEEIYHLTFRTTLAGMELPFKDVASNSWFHHEVEYVYYRGLMNGTTRTDFAPELAATRGMIATILYRLEGQPQTAEKSGFADVADGAYYAGAVAWAAKNGIVNGVNATTFAPDAPITRQDLMTILYRYAVEYKKCGKTGSADLSGYADAGAVRAYAQPAMSWAVAEKLLNGTSSTTLSPDASAARAQVAAFLTRLCENIAS